jgi:hypothetical protein
MPACPNGHDSAATDYCDVCGIRIDAPTSNPEAGPSVPAAPEPPGASAPCPQCGAPGLSRFCETCGYSADSEPAPPHLATHQEPPGAREAPAVDSWTALISASRAHYETVLEGGGIDESQVPFPDEYPERGVPLTGGQLRIGRRSVSREVTPEIDLTGPPADPAISRLHAVLVAQPDGSWAVIDPGSENGTSVNGTEVAIGDLVPLRAGDVICVGAWTAITIVGGSRDRSSQ